MQGATACVAKAIWVHGLLCTCKVLSFKKRNNNKKNPKPQIKPRTLPISSLDRYNHSCLSSHAVKRVTENPLQRPLLDSIWVMTVIHEIRGWGQTSGHSTALRHRLGNKPKSTQQPELLLKGKLLSDTKALQWHEFWCCSLCSEADKTRRDVKGGM